MQKCPTIAPTRPIGYNQITLKELLGGAEGDPETLQIINSQVALFIKKTKRFEI